MTHESPSSTHADPLARENVDKLIDGAFDGASDGAFDGEFDGAFGSAVVGVCVGECVVHVLQSVQSVPVPQCRGSSQIWSFAYWHVSTVIVGAQLVVGAALSPHVFVVVE